MFLVSESTCVVVTQRCDFPFTYSGGEESSSCLAHDVTAQMVCILQQEGSDRWSWAECDDGCFESETKRK
jgi:hypothetical protein